MLNDRVVPVGDVDGSIRTHLDVDGTEGPVGIRNQILELSGRVDGVQFSERRNNSPGVPGSREPRWHPDTLLGCAVRSGFQRRNVGLSRIKPFRTRLAPGEVRKTERGKQN